MPRRKNLEVLVVGAGPVGLAAALARKRRGLDVQIIDRDWRTGAHSYALALHPNPLRLLEEAGLLERALERAYRVETVGLYDGAGRRAEMRLSELDDMNVGLREAEDLAGIIAGVLRDAVPTERLEAYGRERIAEWRQLLGLEGGLRAGDQAEPWVRDHRESLLPCIPASGLDLQQLAAQIGLEA